MTKRATVEVSGRVKWFDVTRGYGFIVCESDHTLGDILIHHSILREHGRRSVPEGAELVVEAYVGDRGMQAAKVLKIDMAGAVPPRRPSATTKTTRQPHGQPGDFELVQVKWFNKVKGYGFLVRGDDDVFVHADTFRKAGLQLPEDGDVIEAKIAHSAKGLLAVALRSAAHEPEAQAA